MLGAYSNIKSRIFPGGGGEKESPFLKDLHDESVVRAMEEWNIEHTDDDSALDSSGTREQPKRNPFGPPYEPRHDEGPFGHHSHLHSYNHGNPHYGNQNVWILLLTYIFKIGILIMSVMTIPCVMASTERVADKACSRPTAALYVLVITFLSIVINLCVLTICERFNLCCTIGRMEFFYHFLAGIFVTIGIFLYGSWLYQAGIPSSDVSLTTEAPSSLTLIPNMTTPSICVTTSTTATLTSETAIIANLTEAANGTNLVNVKTENGTNATLNMNVTASVSTSSNESVLTISSTAVSSLKTAGTVVPSIIVRDRRQLIDVPPEAPNIIIAAHQESLKTVDDTPCAKANLGWREFKYAVASLLIMFGILGTHGSILLFYMFPCMGLMNRENEARTIHNSSLNNNNHREQQHQHRHPHTPAHETEMRSRNNEAVSEAHPMRKITPGRNTAEDNQMSMLRDKFVTSSPNVTPTKNQSLLKKVVNTNMWGSTKRSEDQYQRESILHESVISADQLLETSIEESDANVSAGGVAEINTTGEGDDVLFDAHDSALLHVIVKGGLNE